MVIDKAGQGRTRQDKGHALAKKKPVPERTLAMFLGTKANSKDTVIQEKVSNPQNCF